MALLAYVSGLITTPAAVLGVLGGMWWWRRLRREPADQAVELQPWVPPPPLPPQEAPVLNVARRRSIPASGRRVHGRKLER